MPADVVRLLHTLRYLRPVQLYGRLWLRLARPRVSPGVAPSLRLAVEPWAEPVEKAPSMQGAHRFCFLNRTYDIGGKGGWNDPDREKLWLYNLHYFDDLNAAGAEDRRAWHQALIARWVIENPPVLGSGWEPYPISVRVVNWIKWALAGNTLGPDALVSLATQVRFLRRRLERHLLGNHLFTNAKALVFAGLFFAGPEAERWLQKGRELLLAEVAEQILPDGGHFERSPMYHAIILEDLLDLINLQRAYGHVVPPQWLGIVQKMRCWLLTMQHPDGDIVLFNDAALGISSRSAEIEQYAGRLQLEPVDPPAAPLVHLPESGYARLQNRDAVAFLDVGPVGPDYIPGHAHADTLSFELSLFGRRVIVDSGTSTYEKNAERQRQRGTEAHNTITVDAEDSSEVWGGFRVARRARPFDLSLAETGEDLRVACSHDGYRRFAGKPVPRRTWRLGRRELVVQDRVAGKYREAVARFHFHPEVNVSLGGGSDGVAVLPGGERLGIRIEKGVGRMAGSTYHPAFNRTCRNSCLEVVLAGAEARVVFSW